MNNITVRGLYKPGDTTYRLYEATMSNGDTFAAGAMNEEEFRKSAERFGDTVVSVKCLDAVDIENGWKEARL